MRFRRAVLAASLATVALPGSALAYDDFYGLAENPVRPYIVGDDGTHIWTGPYAAADTAPPDDTNSRVARFRFGTRYSSIGFDSSGVTYECRLDGSEWQACGSRGAEGSTEYTGLEEGAHAFAVRSVDASGTPDETPAEFAWHVDTTPPETTLAPQSFGANGSPPYVWWFHPGSSDPGVSRFWVDVDYGRFYSGAGLWGPSENIAIDTAYGLAGQHRWSFAAVDRAGNVDPTPEYVDFELHDYPDWLPGPEDHHGAPLPPSPSYGFKVAIRGASARTVKVDVTAPVRGALKLRLAGGSARSLTVRHAGKHRLTLKLGQKARAQLRKRGRVKVTAVATLKSAQGARLTTRAKGVLRR